MENEIELERFSAFAVFGLRGWWHVVVGLKAIVEWIGIINCCHVAVYVVFGNSCGCFGTCI